jgi:staphylococcal nuclease domain-containing protein 1
VVQASSPSLQSLPSRHSALQVDPHIDTAIMSAPMEAKVKSVLSGDTLVLQNKNRQERTLSLAFINAPRLNNDEPGSFQSRDYIRKLCVGKTVRFSVLYTIPQKTGGASRDYGIVTLTDGRLLPDSIVSEGWGKLRDDADRKAENPQSTELLERLEALEAHARADEKGLWATTQQQEIQNARELPDTKAFSEQYNGQPIDAIVERVLSGDRLICRLMVTPTNHVQTTVLVAGIKSPATARKNPSDGTSQPAEPWGNESQAFVEDRILQRGVVVRILGVSPNQLLVGEVRHPMGNIAEFTLKEGLARCVDHHSTWLGAEMGKLRQAERAARERQAGLFANNVAQKKTGSEVEAVVSRVFSADTLYIRNKNGVEKRVNLSSVRQPKPTDPKQSPFSAEAKELLRKRLIGKHVKLVIDGKRPATEGYDEREMATVSYNGKNIGLMMVENGYCSVIRHRMDDTDRSPIYDELLAAEEAAQKEGKGMWNTKAPKPQQYVDHSENLEKAKRQMSLLARQKRVPAVVDFVKSGSRFTVLIPRENSKLTFVLGGIRAPRSARGPQDTAEPFGQEAHDFANKRCLQRDVEIDVDDNDKVGGFIGTLYVNRENFAKLLVEEGFASVHAYSAEKNGNAAELFAAEQKAKDGRKGMWHSWDPSQEAAENGDNYDEAPADTNGNSDALPTPKRDYKDVTITHVDPTTARVKLQLLGSGKVNLDSMMKDFASFNLQPGNSQPLPGPPKAGDVVSAKFTQDGQWYRARVRRNDRDAKTSEVVYIDYGNSESQPWSALRVLNERFGVQKLRAQAVDAALSFVQFPTSPEYLADSVAFLHEIAVDRQLVANVDFTDSRDNNLLWVTLLDPSAKDQTESLNAEVISEGLAMVPKKLKPFERANATLLQDLKQREGAAKNERRGMWEYGDLTED